MPGKAFVMHGPEGRDLFWATIAIWIGIVQGPAFLENFRLQSWQARSTLPDFFQEWASARNYYEGLPVYTDHAIPIERYLRGKAEISRSLVTINAHPPTSVILALPFAWLAFETAFLVWNLCSMLMLFASLWIVRSALRVTLTPWSVFPLVAGALLCSPLWQQVYQGQLNLVLLCLLTGSWAAERSGNPRLGGSMLGAAVAVKVFPAFLLIYYIARRRWQVITAALATLAILSAATAFVLGVGTYLAYFNDVIPEVQWFRVGWNNNSAWGFWSRLFDAQPERAREFSRSSPLLYSPATATACALVSSLVVTALLVASTAGVRTPEGEDRAYGLAVTSMLLVSPIAWEHYFLLLLVPLAVFWAGLPRSRTLHASFLSVIVAIWLSPVLVWTVSGVGGRVASPIDNLTIIPYQFYALIGLFCIGLIELDPARGTEGYHQKPWAKV